MSQIQTQIIVIFAFIIFLIFAVRKDALNRIAPVVAVLTFLIGAPLGYDTLKYTVLFENGYVEKYGLLYVALRWLYSISGTRALPYAIGYTVFISGLSRISEVTKWPSLYFFLIIVLPGIGVDYLGLFRQCFAMGFIFHAYIEWRKRHYRRSLVGLVLAAAAHPAISLSFPILLVEKEPNYKRFLVGGVGLLVAGYLVYLNFNIIGELNIVSTYLGRYIYEDTAIELKTGKLLFFYLAFLMITPEVIQNLFYQQKNSRIWAFVTTLFIVAYFELVQISGATARIAFVFLPFMLFRVVQNIYNIRLMSYGKYFSYCYMFLALAGGIYIVLIAQDFYWDGNYPSGVSFENV